MKKTLFVFLILNTVLGVTHNVPADFSTIQLAIDSAVEGDTILVAPGTYDPISIYENISIISTNGPLSTTIDGGGVEKSVYFLGYIVTNSTLLSGFTITNGYNTGDSWNPGYGGGIYCYYASPRLENLIISGNFANYGGGITIYANGSYGDNEVILKNSIITNNESSSGDAVYLKDGASVVIMNSVIADNIVGGIQLDHSNNEVLLINSIVRNNIDSQIRFTSWYNELSTTHSNIEGGEVGLGYIFNNTINWLEGNLDTDPLWDDNYHLTEGSPCIDAGIASFSWNDFVIDIPVDEYEGDAPDMGAYEYAANEIPGCTDPDALNYNPDATYDDSSCEYYDPTLLYVTTDGSDETGDGTEGNPLASIQVAVNQATDNDTILVMPGTYFENLYINTNLLIQSVFGPDTTIIDGGGIDRVVYFDTEVNNTSTFTGFTITNGFTDAESWDPYPDGKGGGILCGNARPKLKDLVINNCYGKYGGAIHYAYSAEIAVIENVLIHDNESEFSIIRMGNADVVLIGSTIINNTVQSWTNGTIDLDVGSTAAIINSMIYGNTGGPTHQIVFNSNNNPNELTIAYSNIEGGEAGVNTNDNGVLNWLDGNIDADPMLDDEYHLMTGSPCIDAGTAYFEWGEFLLDLGPEDYLGEAPDIGVYEFVGLLGDLNADGDINVTDIVLLVDIILTEPGTPYEMWAADYNEDGLVNVSDIVQIVFVILNPPGRTMTVSTTANYQLTENEFVLTVDGAVAGIQLTTSGGYLITDNYLPNGWEFHENGMTVLAFSLDGTSINSGPLFSYGGNLEIVEIIITDWNGNNVATLTPNQFTLHPAYPNPFNPMTNLSYDLPEDTDLTIAIYDLQGRMVEELANGHVSSGSYKVTWQADNQPSGMYFVQMVTGATVQTQKIILLK